MKLARLRGDNIAFIAIRQVAFLDEVLRATPARPGTSSEPCGLIAGGSCRRPPTVDLLTDEPIRTSKP
jgi:hypothetical protein